MRKILCLAVSKKWFDLIASGEKREEYREIKPYWLKALVRQVYWRIFVFILGKWEIRKCNAWQ